MEAHSSRKLDMGRSKLATISVFTFFVSSSLLAQESTKEEPAVALRRPIVQQLDPPLLKEDRIFGSIVQKPAETEEGTFWTWPVISGVTVGAVAVVAASVLGVVYYPRDSKADMHIRISAN